ncbi:hypothetical protein COOONC_02317 [Cooperia oncophora]
MRCRCLGNLARVLILRQLATVQVLQTALSALFYHFVTSIHDPNPTVAQRAIIALRALPSSKLSPFDCFIMDRTSSLSIRYGCSPLNSPTRTCSPSTFLYRDLKRWSSRASWLAKAKIPCSCKIDGKYGSNE